VWWRPGRDARFEPMTAESIAKLRAEFVAHGREHVLGQA
jgi:hypothetical protein